MGQRFEMIIVACEEIEASAMDFRAVRGEENSWMAGSNGLAAFEGAQFGAFDVNFQNFRSENFALGDERIQANGSNHKFAARG